MIEYLLILVLTVAMIMALSKGVGKPLKKYIQSNILGMVGCMLKVGQYPHIAYGICGDALKLKLDMEGSFSNTGGGSGGSTATKTGKDGEDGSEGDKGDPKSAGNSSDSANSSKNRTRYRSSGSTGSLGESDSDDFGGSDTKVVKITTDLGGENNSEFGTGAFQGDQGQTVIIRRIRKDGRIGGSFFLSGDEKAEPEAGDLNISSKQTKKLPDSLITRRIAENSFSIPKSKNRGPQAENIDTEMEFSFFGIIKWGIIFAVLGIFAFFTMSQLNSIRKGWTN